LSFAVCAAARRALCRFVRRVWSELTANTDVRRSTVVQAQAGQDVDWLLVRTKASNSTPQAPHRNS